MPLNQDDAAIIKGMLSRGDRQSDIAAWFQVNSGRVAEINTGEKWSEVKASNNLPPSGPYTAIPITMLSEIREQLESLRRFERLLNPSL